MNDANVSLSTLSQDARYGMDRGEQFACNSYHNSQLSRSFIHARRLAQRKNIRGNQGITETIHNAGEILVNCRKCGAELVESAKFCHSCGAAVHQIRKEEFSVSADDLIEKVKELIREGNVTRIVVKDEKGRTLFEMPVTVGVVGVILAPWLAALGVIAALATRCTLVVERAE